MSDGDEVVTQPCSPGILAFQLRILSGMRGNEPLVEQALQKLGVDQADLARSRAETEHIFAPTGRFENATALLGPPLSSETVNVESTGSGIGLALTKLTYELPLWPSLVFYLLGAPGAPIAHDFGFARPLGRMRFRPDGPEDLQPWSCILDEVIDRFGPPVQEGDIWAPYGEYKFQTRSADGETRTFWTVFSWNLLQHVEWA